MSLADIMERPWRYILDGHTPVPEPNMEAWVDWMVAHQDRHVAETTLETPYGTVWVSTVFLSHDHAFGGAPVLFETMVFPQDVGKGGYRDEFQWRYRTWDEAAAGHAEVVRAFAAGEEVGDLWPND